jgi:hypothetical protein
MSERRGSRRDGKTAGQTAKNRKQNAKEAQKYLSRTNPDLAYIFAKLAKHPEYTFTSNCISVINNCLEAIQAYHYYCEASLKQQGYDRDAFERSTLGRLEREHGDHERGIA